MSLSRRPLRRAGRSALWRDRLPPRFLCIRTVDVAFLDVEAVEAQQGGLLAVDIGRHLDGDTLVRMILDIGIPQLVPDDEGQRIGGKSGSLRLWHVGRSCWGFARAYRGGAAVTRVLQERRTEG